MRMIDVWHEYDFGDDYFIKILTIGERYLIQVQFSWAVYGHCAGIYGEVSGNGLEAKVAVGKAMIRMNMMGRSWWRV